VSTCIFKARSEPIPEDCEKYSRRQYYSKADVKKILDYAEKKHVTIIPEIGTPHLKSLRGARIQEHTLQETSVLMEILTIYAYMKKP
jgi:hypothetical protein